MGGFLLFAIFFLTAVATALFLGPGQARDPVQERLEELARRVREPDAAAAGTLLEGGGADEVTDAERRSLNGKSRKGAARAAAEPGKEKPRRMGLRERLRESLKGLEGKLQGPLRDRLMRAGLQVRPSEFLVMQMLSVALGLLVGLGLLGPALGWLLALAGWWVPPLWLRRQERRRLRSLEQQIPDALDMIANSLRSGYSLLQALEVVSRELGGPLGAEFAQALRENQVGLSLDEALTRLSKRVGSPDLDLVVTAVLIQRRVGGNLAEVIERIGHTVRGRIQLLAQVRTLTTQGRLSGWIVGLLPVAVGLALYALSRDYMGPFLHHPLGWLLLGVAAFMEMVGVTIIRRLVQLEV